MQRIEIWLQDALYTELTELSAGMHEQGCTPEVFATEIVESELASRRLPRIPVGRCGGRPGGAAAIEADVEPEGYRLCLPKRNDGLND